MTNVNDVPERWPQLLERWLATVSTLLLIAIAAWAEYHVNELDGWLANDRISAQILLGTGLAIIASSFFLRSKIFLSLCVIAIAWLMLGNVKQGLTLQRQGWPITLWNDGTLGSMIPHNASRWVRTEMGLYNALKPHLANKEVTAVGAACEYLLAFSRVNRCRTASPVETPAPDTMQAIAIDSYTLYLATDLSSNELTLVRNDDTVIVFSDR